MARYIPTGTAGPTYPPGAPKCGPLEAGSSAFAFDMVDKTCYRIEGLAITIGPKAASMMAAMEVYNFNVSMNGTQAPFVNSLQLNARVVV